ncbi:GyrI-like domain-containing protein [Flavobacterium maritimum]|uniref:GyrI-like domain-containing protein n=1 Tax=Flavobacterium maritimum TaxID=3149042 RepID=UPI0032B43350
MIPTIKILAEKKLIGKRMQMSLANNKTMQLWQSFMPRRREVQNTIGTYLYSMQVYDPSYFNSFNLEALFEKWAAVEVLDFDTIPNEMETFILPGGLYAVFHHKGQSTAIFEYIFRTWLPNAEYLLDQRPHFELLGEKYKKEDPNSEEEIWIPIKAKQ